MQAIIVTGAESSGTRLMANIIEAGGYTHDDAMECEAEQIVIHRSVPYGPQMPNLAGMVNQLRGKGYGVRAVVMVRNPFAVAASQVAAGHSVDMGQAFQKQQAAFSFIGEQLGHVRCDFLPLTYETLVARPEELQAEIAAHFELPEVPNVEVTDENGKYYEA